MRQTLETRRPTFPLQSQVYCRKQHALPRLGSNRSFSVCRTLWSARQANVRFTVRFRVRLRSLSSPLSSLRLALCDCALSTQMRMRTRQARRTETRRDAQRRISNRVEPASQTLARLSHRACACLLTLLTGKRAFLLRMAVSFTSMHV